MQRSDIQYCYILLNKDLHCFTVVRVMSWNISRCTVGVAFLHKQRFTKCPSIHQSISLPHNPSISALWPPYGCSSWVPYCLATTSSIFSCSTARCSTMRTFAAALISGCSKHTLLFNFIHFIKCKIQDLNQHEICALARSIYIYISLVEIPHIQ